MTEELEEMPIWQDHERRITTLENTFTSFSSKVDNVEKTINKQGDEQKQLLNTLIEHHLSTKKVTSANLWKVILNITGAGGLLATITYAGFQLLN